MPSRLLVLAIAIAASQSDLSAQAPWAGAWLFDETSGLVAQDIGPFANHGALTNFGSQTAWVPGMFGNAVQVDGVDDYIEFATNGGIPIYRGDGAPFSVCFWVKAPPQDDDRVYSEGNSAVGSFTGALFTLGTGRSSLTNMDKLQVYIRNDSQSFIVSRYSASTVFDDTWHHVCYVDVAGDASVYVDGVLDLGSFDYTNAGNGPQTSGWGPFTMDKVAVAAVVRNNAVAHLQGLVDDLRIFPFALSATDVQTVFAGGFPAQCSASIGKFGVGCTGPFDVNATGSASLGGPGIQLSVANGTPSALTFMCWGWGPIAPLDLGPLGFPGCTAYPPSLACTVVGLLDPSGSLTALPILIPNDPGLACLQLDLQMAALSVPLSLELSGVVIATLGL